MSMIIPEATSFSFTPRPVPIPGDLRINWRLSIVLLILGNSRAHRASLAKLHVLNYALRSTRARNRLDRILAGSEWALSWQMRVEPAFGRALDFAVGEKFAQWTTVSNRTGLELAKDGLRSFDAISKIDDVLQEEKSYLAITCKRVTEQFITNLMQLH